MTRSQMKILMKIGCIFLFVASYAYADHATEGLRILSEYSKEMQRKYDLVTVGSGGAMMKDIEMLGLRFNTAKKLTIPEARKLYVNVIEGLINKTNNDKKARPYLHDYPFTQKNVNIMISFYKSHPFIIQNRMNDGFITLIFISRGNICYNIYDPTKDEYKRLVTIHEEPYEEALKIVQKDTGKTASKTEQIP